MSDDVILQTFEASRVFEHLTSLGVKPNAMSYSLLVDAHLINRDQKAALSVIDEMVCTSVLYVKPVYMEAHFDDSSCGQLTCVMIS